MSDVEALRSPASRVWFGGDYNPEQWPRTVLDEDLELMAIAQVNTVTVGVFAWSSLEPAPGEYDFGWLDAAMDRLHAAGVRVVLATPTASPPPWFSRLHPEALPVTQDGVRLIHGSRDTYNPAAPAYRAAAARITRVLAERYAQHPALALWHLHNEYGSISYGPVTDDAFRIWLRERYGDLDVLNAAWNTAFWSQGYREWDDIHAPQRTQYLPNPTQVLDFKRFSAEILLECVRDQVRIVREITPRIPVTTNFMLPTWNNYDQWAFAHELDVISIDHYPDSEEGSGDAQVAFGADLARSFAGGDPWLLMEQATTVTYDYAAGRFLAKDPGQMRRHTFQYLARGSIGSLFFQWRAPVVGAEFFHSAMIPHAGRDTRTFREITALGEDLARLGEALKPPASGQVGDARVAIVWSADAWWATQTRAMPSTDIAFLPAVQAVHEALWREGFLTDFVSPDGDFARYDLVLVPSLIPVSDTQAAAFSRYVAGGGHLAVWYLSGSTDEHLHVRQGSYSAAFADLAGIRVEEQVPLRDGARITLSDGSAATAWSEVIRVRDAEVVAHYTADAGRVVGDGGPAVTRRHHGAGIAHYFSTRLYATALRTHVARLAAEAGIAPVHPDRQEGIDIVRRRAGTDTMLFVINHRSQEVTVRCRGTELLSGRAVDGAWTIASGDVAVIREHKNVPTEAD